MPGCHDVRGRVVEWLWCMRARISTLLLACQQHRMVAYFSSKNDANKVAPHILSIRISPCPTSFRPDPFGLDFLHHFRFRFARYWAAGISTRMKLHSYLPPSPRLAGSQAHPRGHRRHAASLCFHATLPAKLAFAAYPSMWISVRITSMWTIWQRATFVRCRRHIRCSTFLDYVDGYCQIGKWTQSDASPSWFMVAMHI